MNDVPLRDYFERLLEVRDREHSAQLAAAEKAVGAATETLNARLEHMNEFRRQIDLERSLYVRRDQLDPILQRLQQLEQHRSNLDGRFAALSIVVAIGVALLTAALRLWMR